MKLEHTLQYATQYRILQDAQSECNHWDYEMPNGVGFPCCNRMLDAQDKLSQIKRKLLKKA